MSLKEPFKIALLSATGKEGPPLALRWAMAGHEITIGSRNIEKARDVAHGLMSKLEDYNIRNPIKYGDNAAVVEMADIVVLTMPYKAFLEALPGLKENIRPHTIIICPILNLAKKEGELVNDPMDQGSVAKFIAKALPQASVASAFQTVSANRLANSDLNVIGDVPICSDHKETTEIVKQLITDIPDLRPIESGGLQHSRFIEDLAAFIINIGRKTKKTDLGVKFV
ncbi:MAG: NADPH-dependent F420 reductase [Deltaproteobacteria bacterium]|nr:NADPH-dependent F420 reductase [Deltaproteobacteria bacterium]